MKDKVFLPSIVLTMVFLIVFMVICIKTQASMAKELSVRLARAEEEIKIIRQLPIQESIQRESEKLKAEIDVMRNEIKELRKDLEKAKTATAPKKSKR